MTGIRDCPICGASRAETVPSFPDGLAVLVCADCGLARTNLAPDPAGRAEKYGRGYFSGDAETSMDIDYIKNAGVFENDARERFGIMRPFLPKTGGRVLEAGPAAGFFLKELEKNGHSATGVELSGEMCAAARAAGLDCVHGSVEDVSLSDSRFDAAAMWHVLEHLENPLGALKTIHDKLVPGGRVFITVPNFDSGNSRRMLAGWPHLQLGAHLSHFTPKTLSMILEKAGFRVESLFKSGGTGVLGNSSRLPGPFKKLVSKNMSLLAPLRKIVKFLTVGVMGRDDFITMTGVKK